MNLFRQNQSSPTYKLVKLLIVSNLVFIMCRIYQQLVHYKEIKTITVFDGDDTLGKGHKCVKTKALHKGFHDRMLSILQVQYQEYRL